MGSAGTVWPSAGVVANTMRDMIPILRSRAFPDIGSHY